MFLSSCIKQEKDNLSQEIKNWEFEYENAWYEAGVPGNNFSDLLNHGLISDPFYGTNEDSVRWIAEKNWNYRSKFSVSEKTLIKNNQLLVFKGLDTYAKIYLNDSLLLVVDNMFQTWDVDVSNILKKENTLTIKFNAASKIEKQKQTALGYSLPGGDRVLHEKQVFITAGIGEQKSLLLVFGER